MHRKGVKRIEIPADLARDLQRVANWLHESRADMTVEILRRAIAGHVVDLEQHEARLRGSSWWVRRAHGRYMEAA